MEAVTVTATDLEIDVNESVIPEDVVMEYNSNNGNDGDDDSQQVVIKSKTECGDDYRPLIRQDWMPYWDLLLSQGVTLENIDEFTDRHCGNCARGMNATKRKYRRSLSLQGCGIKARIKMLEDGMVRVTSHCSGRSHVYPADAIELSGYNAKRSIVVGPAGDGLQ